MTAFVADLSKFAAKAKGNMDAVVRKVVLDVGTSVVQKSPVGDGDYWKHPPPPGYVGGRFRGNWQYAFGQIPSGELATIDPTGAASINGIFRGVASQASVAGIHYVANNLPYAKRLEEGWSYRQAPQGMVMLTITEYQSFFKRALAKL